jgi:hypothetical protein
MISKQICVGCLCEAGSNAFHPACNHFYCQECLTNLCRSTTSPPLQCLGKNGSCGHVFTVQDLLKLPSSALDALLESSFVSHVRSHQETYRHCPTPGCDQIYDVRPKGELICSSCLTLLCRACNAPSHFGVTCNDSLTADKVFKSYKDTHGIRDCPKCHTPLAKNGGCNHIECLGCYTHI